MDGVARIRGPSRPVDPPRTRAEPRAVDGASPTASRRHGSTVGLHHDDDRTPVGDQPSVASRRLALNRSGDATTVLDHPAGARPHAASTDHCSPTDHCAPTSTDHDLATTRATPHRSGAGSAVLDGSVAARSRTPTVGLCDHLGTSDHDPATDEPAELSGPPCSTDLGAPSGDDRAPSQAGPTPTPASR